jgi:hypothetical protein
MRSKLVNLGWTFLLCAMFIGMLAWVGGIAVGAVIAAIWTVMQLLRCVYTGPFLLGIAFLIFLLTKIKK